MTSGRYVVNLRGWPGLDNYRPPAPPPDHTDRLGDRLGLVLFAAAEFAAIPERFGLGAYLVVVGRSVLAAGLIVPDRFQDADPLAASDLYAWARAHVIDTTSGPRPCSVVTVSDFYDPRRGVFTKVTYSGAGWGIGADHGRTLGLAAEQCTARRGQDPDSWELWLPGWGQKHPTGWKRRSPHRPPLRVSARRVGWQVEFGPCGTDRNGKPAGKRVGGRPWRGAFVDVLSLAYALDADRSASFTEHCANFGLAPTELPIAVAVDDDGASRVAGAVVAIHSLAVVLDDHAGRWFTTSQEQSQGRGQLDLVRTSSPGGVAANLLGRFGVRAPIKTFDLDDTEHKEWTETLHGGWCEADPRFLGVPFQAISLDAESCYPLVARHLGWWDLLCAESIERHTITGEFERLCQSAVVDPTVALDPATWRRFGVTLVQCIPDGEPFPIEIKDVHRPDGRMEVVPVFSPEGWSLLFPWPDVLAAAMRSRRVPNIVRAIHYAPVGRQTGIQPRLSVLPGLELAGHCDPVLDLVQHRHVLKVRGERVLAGEVRVVLNSLVYGILSRFDETHSRQGRRWILDERPGPWICVPIASSVAAGARLLLGTLDRLVTDRGSAIAYRDTDSSLIPSSPGGGELRLADGSTIRELSWFEVEEILALFDRLSPAPWWPVW